MNAHPLVYITNAEHDRFDSNLTQWYAESYGFARSRAPAELIMLDIKHRAALVCLSNAPWTQVPEAVILRRVNRRVLSTWFEDAPTACMVFEAGCGRVNFADR